MPAKIKFNADEHKYYVSGKEIPSVTTILKELTILDDRWFKPGRDRIGTRVHEYLDLLDKDLKVAIPPTIKGYIDGYLNFRKAHPDLEPIAIEQSVYDKKLKICGKVDRIFNNINTGVKILIDIKTGVKLRFHALQCTAYAVALGDKSIRTGGLYLNGDSSYQFKEYDRQDTLWKSCVRVYDFKVRR